MIGYNLITKQTKAEGLPVKAVLIHEGVDINKQIYIGFLMDRKYGGPLVIASSEGGMEIEEVAHSTPEKIFYEPVDIVEGLTPQIAEKIVNKLPFDNDTQRMNAIREIQNLYKLFIGVDASQVEINPWAVTPEDEVYCVDAKINIDDNAIFRQKELYNAKKNSVATEDTDPNEDKATDVGLNYVGLNGSIGCMVNGAGLAMATMDIIKLKGSEPANFLDVGGGANVQQVKTAFQILCSHPQVEAILVNIFGGIMRCDIIAEGIMKAAQEVDIKVPLVVRLTGTNAEQGNKLMKEFTKKNQGKYNIIVGDNLDDAANKVVKALKEVKACKH